MGHIPSKVKKIRLQFDIIGLMYYLVTITAKYKWRAYLSIISSKYPRENCSSAFCRLLELLPARATSRYRGSRGTGQRGSGQ